jgi:hypothetical protein
MSVGFVDQKFCNLALAELLSEAEARIFSGKPMGYVLAVLKGETLLEAGSPHGPTLFRGHEGTHEGRGLPSTQEMPRWPFTQEL